MLSAGVVVTDPEFRKRIVAGLQRLGVRIAFDVEDATTPVGRRDPIGPDLLVLDFSQPGAPGIMAELKSAQSPVAVIAAFGLHEPEAILTAVRLGAREFVSLPLNEAALAEAVRTIGNEKTEREARRKMASAVGFLAATGGSGASVIACHVAAELRRSGAGRVGLLDFDLAGGMAGLWFGVDGGYSILDAVHNLGSMDASLWKGLVSAVQPELDVLGAPAGIPLGALPDARGFAGVLRYARSQYDWVVVDLAAQLTPFSAGLLDELDTLYLVATPEVASLLQARRIVQKLIQLNYPQERVRLLVSRVEKDQVLSAEELKSMIGLPVEGIFPSDRVEIASAHAVGRLISPKSDFGRRIAQLAGRLTGKPVEESKPAVSRFSRFRALSQGA